MIVGKGVAGGIAILISIFTALIMVISSIVTVPQNLLGGEDITVITKANDPNPLRSNLNIEIAYALKNMSFIDVVSPEIIVFSIYKGEAVTVRGVWFREFLEIENGKLIEGRFPNRTDECIVGEAFAKRMNVLIGDTITLFGSFKSSVAIVKVVGIYRTKTLSNEEILVSLPIARNLCGLGKNTVSIIRVKSKDKERMRMIAQPNYAKFILTDVDIPLNAYLYDKVPVKFTVRNWGGVGGNTSVEIYFCNRTYKKRIYVDEDSEKNFVMYVNATELGNKTINIFLDDRIFPYSYSTTIQVSLRPLFVTYSEYLKIGLKGKIVVSSIDGVVKNATVIVEGKEYRTDENGTAEISFDTVGTKKIIVKKDGYKTEEFEIKVFRYVLPENLFRIVYPKLVIGENFSFYLVNSSRKMVFATYNNKTNLSYGYWNSETVEIENNTLYFEDWKDGWYNITIYGEDEYNRTWENITLFIDSAPPEVSVNYPVASKIRPGEALIVKVGDNFNLTYAKIGIYNSTFSYENITDNFVYNNTQNFSGPYRVVVNASDLAGNWKNISMFFIFLEENDTTPPNVSINVTSRHLYMSPGQSIYIKFEDNFRIKNATVVVRYEGNVIRRINTSMDVVIKTYYVNNENLKVTYWKEGNYSIFVYAQDPYGNSYSSTTQIVMGNKPDLAKPIILYDLEKNVLSYNDSFNVFFWDNYKLAKVGYWGNNCSVNYSLNSDNTKICINVYSLPPGKYNLTLYAEDYYGNNATIVLQIEVLKYPIINYSAYLTPTRITVNESAVVAVNVWNSGEAPGTLYINITVDGASYISTYITILPQQRKSFVFNLPPLEEGRHTITVLNYTFYLMVYRYSVGNIPVEKILRYTKDICIKAKGEAVYKALELSEGNFILFVLSIISTDAALLVMGVATIFSKSFRSKEKNIGILRAIGATKTQIFKIILKEIIIWCGLGILAGGIIGNLVVVYVSNNGMIRAFGHGIKISVEPIQILIVFLLSVLVVVFTGIFLTLRLLKKRTVEIIRKIARIEKGIDIEELWREVG